MKITSKAYQIDFSRIEEGYLYSAQICHAENRNKAKSLFIDKTKWEDLQLRGTNESVTYLTIPVIRCKQADKYEFEGKEMTNFDINLELGKRKRLAELDGILNNEDIKFCYIKKGSYYRPNSCGYTDYKSRAGIYTKEEAVSHAKSCSDLTLEVIDIKSHNKMINEEINEFSKRLITV